MTLFDASVSRSDKTKSHTESSFSFLERYDGHPFDEVRAKLEHWFSNYPEGNEKKLLKDRMRNEDNRHFLAAVFELYVHHLLRELGCTAEPHPRVGSYTAKRPDFLVTSKENEKFYLEATIVTQESDKQAELNRMKNAFSDLLDKEPPHPRLMIDINVGEGEAPSICSPEKAIADIRKRLDAVDYDEVKNRVENGEDEGLPSWPYQIGFPIEVTPTPRIEGNNCFFGAIFDSGAGKDIRKQLRTKMQKKYGDFGLPYIVAIDVVDDRFGPQALTKLWESVIDSMFGDVCLRFPIGDRTKPGELTRRENGAFVGQNKLMNTTVSGILVFKSLTPWHLDESDLCLFPHPAPRHECPALLKRFAHFNFENGFASYVNGISKEAES